MPTFRIGFKDNPTDGFAVGWYRGGDDAPFNDPVNNAGRLIFHSDLRYAQPESTHSFSYAGGAFGDNLASKGPVRNLGLSRAEDLAWVYTHNKGLVPLFFLKISRYWYKRSEFNLAEEIIFNPSRMIFGSGILSYNDLGPTLVLEAVADDNRIGFTLAKFQGGIAGGKYEVDGVIDIFNLPLSAL